MDIDVRDVRDPDCRERLSVNSVTRFKLRLAQR
jgi:hypothetical protein